jgi:hypothetical protein
MPRQPRLPFCFDSSLDSQWHAVKKQSMKRILIAVLPLLVCFMSSAKDMRCFELRTYTAAPGKLEDLHTRFRNHTLRLFEKHGMQNIGYWVPMDKDGKPENKLVFLLAYPSREAREKAWSAFQNDPDWKAAAKSSEANGPLVSKVENPYLEATDYSPDIKTSKSATPRLFELRIYKTPAGRLDDLHARFRDHTIGLFSKHGMSHLGYWTPMDAKHGKDNTLIYILAHKDREAAAASFATFRKDPDWVAARKASEEKAGGSLTLATDGVTSIFMTPTDYSPTR